MAGNFKGNLAVAFARGRRLKFRNALFEICAAIAAEIGRSAAILVEIIMRERTHPEQGFRACVGIMRLAKGYSRERFEVACAHALAIGARSYRSVLSILKTNADQARLRHDDRNRPADAADGPAIAHDNIRGPDYFH